MKTFLSLIFLVLFSVTVSAQMSHDKWDGLLQTYVDEKGLVDYAGLKKAEGTLDAYLQQLQSEAPTDSWSREERMAYWINTYNAYTVKLILKHYPVSSIRDIHDGNPWDVEWIPVGSRKLSLNQIEHDILRRQFDEPAIHFAVNCAARSCPPLHHRAWTADKLDTLFEQQARAFINDERFNRISSSEASVSRIFDWYAEDFGDLRAYLKRYSRSGISEKAPITFQEYDWSLNRR